MGRMYKKKIAAENGNKADGIDFESEKGASTSKKANYDSDKEKIKKSPSNNDGLNSEDDVKSVASTNPEKNVAGRNKASKVNKIDSTVAIALDTNTSASEDNSFSGRNRRSSLPKPKSSRAEVKGFPNENKNNTHNENIIEEENVLMKGVKRKASDKIEKGNLKSDSASAGHPGKTGGSRSPKNVRDGKKRRMSIKKIKNVQKEETKQKYVDISQEEYEVQDIMGQKVERGIVYYRIRWKGYGEGDDTWEPEHTLFCSEIIEKFKKKQAEEKKGGSVKKKRSPKVPKIEDPEKEWEVEKIIDYGEDKNGRFFRIRWKGFSSKHDSWEPEENLFCKEMIEKFMKRMKDNEELTFKELREEPKKTKRFINESVPRTISGRKSKRSSKFRVYYGDSD